MDLRKISCEYNVKVFSLVSLNRIYLIWSFKKAGGILHQQVVKEYYTLVFLLSCYVTS